MADSIEASILVESTTASTVISIHRPQALNALSLDMIEAIRHEINRSEHYARPLIFVSTASKAFCAGGDIKKIALETQKDGGIFAQRYFTAEYAMDREVHESTRLTAACIEGLILGGGIGLTSGCKLRLASPQSYWAMPEGKIGFFPDVGMSHFVWNSAERDSAFFWFVTGLRIDGTFASLMGLATHLIDPVRFQEFKKTVCLTSDLEKIISEFTISLDAKDVESWHAFSAPLRGFSEIESFDGFLERIESLKNQKHPAIQSALKTMAESSPLSICLAVEQLMHTRNKTLKECFDLDLNIGCKIIHEPDFQEGIDSMLIRKDGKPRWSFSSLSDAVCEKTKPFFKNT